MMRLFPLILIVFLVGCGKSMKDVAGVYETQETKTPSDGSGSWHHSSKWILDLSEGGKFTLKEEKFKMPTRDKMYAPIPEKGAKVSGEWKMNKDSVSLGWMTFRILHKDEKKLTEFGDPASDVSVNASITAEIQSTGDLVMGEINLTKRDPSDLDPQPWDIFLLPTNDIQEMRFLKQE